MALGPYTEKTALELIYVNAISGASGFRINDKTITLDFTEEAIVTQPTATQALTVQPYQFARFEGEIRLNPETDFFTSERLVPTTTNQTSDTQGLNNLVNAANQPNILNSTILPVTAADDLLLSSLVPINASQFTGGLLSATSGLNVPTLSNSTDESIWGVLNAEPASTVDTARTVDGQRPISSLNEFFGVATDEQSQTSSGGSPTIVDNTLSVDSSQRRATGGGRVDNFFFEGRAGRR